jgi:HAD superfamily hydrolase (TIGR01509 family)
MIHTTAPNRRVPPNGPVIFDCDGTIVATEGVWDGAYATIFDRHQVTLTRTDRHRLIGLNLDGLGHEIARLLDRPHLHRELAAEVLNLVKANLGRGIAALPGAVDLITALARRRPVGIASNNLHAAVVEYLTHIGVIDLVDVIVGSDDVAAPKPAPDVYQQACRQLGADPATAIAVEDSATGIAAARAAGMYVIGIPSQPDLHLPADILYASLADPDLHRMLRYPTPTRMTA